MRVHFVASDAAGGGHLRGAFPAAALDRLPGWSATWGLPPEIPPAEVYLVHRPLWNARSHLVAELQRTGARVLVDEDDALEWVGQTKNSIAIELCTPEALREHRDSIERADGLTVATPALAELYGPLNARTTIVRNRLPTWVQRATWHWGRSGPPPSDGITRVGWQGIVKTHLHDLEWLRPEVQGMGGRFVTIGDADVLKVLGIQGEAHPYQTTMRGLYKLIQRTTDVGIVPLRPCPFNVAKSWLKALEFMSLGIPVVATDLPEQRELIEHGVNGFLAPDPESFVGYVRSLVNDAELRQAMGQAARARAAELAIEGNTEGWEAASGAEAGLLHAS